MTDTLRYTDRDVRENPDFYNIVHNYLVDYSGEFSFLIDCKMRIAQNLELSTGMIRGVLNCMRVDPRVTNLPAPQEWPDDVIPIDRETSLRKKRVPRRDCTNTEPHTHTFDDWKFLNYCPGVYEFNREGYVLPVNIKITPAYAKAKSPSSILIHFATSAKMQWFPRVHEEGFYRDPELIVRTNCKYPYTLRNPVLFGEKQYEELLTRGYEQCQRCMYEGVVLPRM